MLIMLLFLFSKESPNFNPPFFFVPAKPKTLLLTFGFSRNFPPRDSILMIHIYLPSRSLKLIGVSHLPLPPRFILMAWVDSPAHRKNSSLPSSVNFTLGVFPRKRAPSILRPEFQRPGGLNLVKWPRTKSFLPT